MFYWVSLGSLGLTRFYRDFTGICWVLLGFIELVGFYWALMGFTGFYWVLMGFTGFYRAYWV